MKRKVSIQKGFVFGVTAIAVLAIAVGMVVRFGSISADVAQNSNADSVTDCYRTYSIWGSKRCYEKYAAACTRTERLATKAEVSPTAQEIQSYGDKVKAYDVGINNGNPNAKFRMTISARRTGTTGPVRFDVTLTPKMINWGGNGDNITLIFPDGLGYKKKYNYITKATTWSSYINKEITTGSVNILFTGKNEDGCIKSVINIAQALATPTPAPSPSPSPSPSVRPSVSPSATPTLDPNLVAGLKGCYYNGKNFEILKANRNENINFIWGSGPATASTDGNNFSARWEGYIIPKYSESYTFKINYDDAARVWIGGRQYINDWANGSVRSKSTSAIAMQAGVAVPIKVEYFESTGLAEVQLKWQSQSQAESIIPVANLKHMTNYTCAPSTQTATPTPSPSPSRTPSPIPSPSRTVTVSAVSSIVPITPTPSPTVTVSNAPELSVRLEAVNPNIIVKNGTKLRATHASSVAGKMTLRFYCDTTSTQIIDQYSDEVLPSPKVTDNLCIYSKAGTYTAKVVYTVAGKTATSTAQIKVNPGGTVSVVPVSPIPIEPVKSIDTTKLRGGVKADYFKGQTLSDDNLLISKLEKNIYFNWGNTAPATGVPTSNFSSRYNAKLLAPETGDYSIGVLHNDGVRVWLGGKLVINQWLDWDPNSDKCARTATCDTASGIYRSSTKVHLEAGRYYDLKVEHYDKNGRAVLKLYWKKPSASEGGAVQNVLFTPYNPNPPYGSGTGLLGSYYPNKDLTSIRMQRKDRQVNFNWGSEGPASEWRDQFSARWEGYIQPRFSETYNIIVQVNDGARLWIDGKQVIDKWVDSATNQTYSAKVTMTAGKKYPIKLEMYENTGSAMAILRWKSASEAAAVVPAAALYPISVPTPSPTPSVSPSPSPSASVSIIGSPSPSPSPSPSLSPSQTPTPTEKTITFQPGFTPVNVPDADKPYLTGALAEAGLSYYQYGPLVYALDPESNTYKKTWFTAADKFNHKIGYYVKNPGTAPVTVNLKLSTEAETSYDAMVYRGWNLLANGSATPKKLADLTYEKRICTDESSNATCDGYSATVNFGNLSYGWKGQGKAAYTQIWVLDQTTNTLKEQNVLRDGLNNVQIPANSLFWFYFFD